LFSQIHDIVFNSQGGYDWNTIYNMPVWLRLFTFSKLRDHYEKQKDEMDKQQSMLKNKSGKSDVARPNIATSPAPTYTAKAPKK
jgi:hypothetical protein